MERFSPKPAEDIDIVISPETEYIDYSPKSIDEYLVIVNDKDDWEEIHNYIIEENELDGIPNRKIECSNIQEYSLRSSIYLMSVEEAEILKSHPKIERVELNPDKYPQPQSLMTMRYKREVAFNKPTLIGNIDNGSVSYTNGVRSNWSHLFVNQQSSEPFRGVGITTTDTFNTDISYSIDGRGVDAVIIDSGVAYLHPEFLREDGTTRVRDVILDGPFKVDPEYFITNNLTYQKTVDGVNVGVGIATTAAQAWWSNSFARSAKFQSLGTVSISSSYDLEHVSTKTVNGDENQLIDGHGTACASQIGGKSFGLAFECNIWNIRIALGGVGGIISGSTALNACALWHEAKKVASDDPDPTLINNSWGQTSSTGNTSSVTYTHNYRGSILTYTGTGSASLVPANAGGCRNHKYFSVNSSGSSASYTYSGDGQYTPVDSGASTSSAAENAIASGCIVTAAAGNQNQKFSDVDDIDYGNWYSTSSNYYNRCGGVQKGFSGEDKRIKGTIRVGALDNGVEPTDSKQGAQPYSIRKVVYSNNGPMITIWAPAEMTMAAGYYGSYEDYQRNDDSNFYDTWFNGTSSACPNACSVIALFLSTKRKANQSDVIKWIDRYGSVEISNLSDPYPEPTESGYWSISNNSLLNNSSSIGDSYNWVGNGNLRGAVRKVLNNPFSQGTSRMESPSISGVQIQGILFTQT